MELGSLVSRSPSIGLGYAQHHQGNGQPSHAGSTMPHAFPTLAQQPLALAPPQQQQQQQQKPQGHQQQHSALPSPSITRLKRATLTVYSEKVFAEAAQYPPCKLGYWTYNPTIRLSLPLRVNGVFHAHIPRRFLEYEQNTALRRRKVWGTDVYTDDSDLVAILLHSNMAKRIPKTGDIKMAVRVMPPLVTYKSSMRHDLRSRGWMTRHDGLSLVVEEISGVSSSDEIKGKGYAKRALAERARLASERTLQAAPVLDVKWPAELHQRRASRALKPKKVSALAKDSKKQIQQQSAAPGDKTAGELGEGAPAANTTANLQVNIQSDVRPTNSASGQATHDVPSTATDTTKEKEIVQATAVNEKDPEDVRKRDLTGADILDAARRITLKKARSRSRSPLTVMTSTDVKRTARDAHVLTGRKDPPADRVQAQVEAVAALIEEKGRPVEKADGQKVAKAKADSE